MYRTYAYFCFLGTVINVKDSSALHNHSRTFSPSNLRKYIFDYLVIPVSLLCIPVRQVWWYSRIISGVNEWIGELASRFSSPLIEVSIRAFKLVIFFINEENLCDVLINIRYRHFQWLRPLHHLINQVLITSSVSRDAPLNNAWDLVSTIDSNYLSLLNRIFVHETTICNPIVEDRE